MVTYCIVAALYVLACVLDLKFFTPKNEYDRPRTTYVLFAISCAVCGLFSPIGQVLALGVMLLCRRSDRKQARELQEDAARGEVIRVNMDEAFKKLIRELTNPRG